MPDEEHDEIKRERQLQLERKPADVQGVMWDLCKIDFEATAQTIQIPDKHTDVYRLASERVIAISGNWHAPALTPFHMGAIKVPIKFFYAKEHGICNKATLVLRQITLDDMPKKSIQLVTQNDMEEYNARENEFWAIPTYRMDYERRLEMLKTVAQ